MPRTIINLDPDDKHWIDQEANDQRVAMTEVVRRAIKAYRVQRQSRSDTEFKEILSRTAGIWRSEQGIDYQDRIRDEWDDRP